MADQTGLGSIIDVAVDGFRLQSQANAQNSLIAVAQKATKSAISWKNHAEELAAQLEANKANSAEWIAYAKMLSDRVKWLENNLKRQSANRKGLDAVRVMLLTELEKLSDPVQCKALNPQERQKVMDEEFEKFMRGDQIMF